MRVRATGAVDNNIALKKWSYLSIGIRGGLRDAGLEVAAQLRALRPQRRRIQPLRPPVACLCTGYQAPLATREFDSQPDVQATAGRCAQEAAPPGTLVRLSAQPG